MENTCDDHLLLSSIPEDILIQILVLLPVISLLRFKSVCKSWRDLIESSLFIHLHALTTTSSSSSNFGTFIFQTLLQQHYDTMETDRIFMLSSSSSSSFSSRSRSSGNGGEVFEMEDLGFPPLLLYNNNNKVVVPASTHNLLMVGSCNGIVCLYDSKLKRDVCLWNPATRQFRLLPKSLSFQVEKKRCIDVEDGYAFGFDVKTKDYKVLHITHFVLRPLRRYMMSEIYSCLSEEEEEDVEHALRIQVYSLSSNSWRLLEGEGEGEEGEGGGGGIYSILDKKAFQGLNMRRGLYLNGSYFFGILVFEEDGIREWILSFDFTKEIFTIVQFPDELDLKSTLILTYFGGGDDKIAFFIGVAEEESSSSREGGGGGGECDQSNYVYDIWVLNIIEHDQEEEEEEESYCWTKLQHSIRIQKWERIFPIGISNDGEFALIETTGGNGIDWKLQLFNLVTKEEKTVFPIGKEVVGAEVYKPSLVSIIGGNGSSSGSSPIGG